MKYSQLVPIPDETGIHIKRTGADKAQRVYKYTEHFYNEAGQKRHRSILIGRVAEKPGLMIPNDNYFELYGVDSLFSDLTLYDYGYTYVMERLAEQLHLLSLLHSIFGSEAEDILAMAYYIAAHNPIMDGMEYFQSRNWLRVTHKITSSRASKIFSEISYEQQDRFFKEWISFHYLHGSVCYDVTSISSYSTMVEIERGYNRDHEQLNQFNLGLFSDQKDRIPLLFEKYNGSLTDKGNLKYVLSHAYELGIENVHLFADGGFWSPECIKSANEFCKAFTIGMPVHLKEAKAAIDSVWNTIDQYEYQLNDYPLYCQSVPFETSKVKGKILVYFDPLTQAVQREEIKKEVARREATLRVLKRYPKNHIKHYLRYFDLHEKEDGSWTFEKNLEKIEQERRYKGYFCLFTNDSEMNSDDQLFWYRAKDTDEKLFEQTKVEMDGNRMRTHNTKTTDGKVFVIFIALILRSFLLAQLRDYLKVKKTSFKRVLEQLSNIIVIERDRKKRLKKALTKTQKDILKQLDLDEDILESLN